MKALLLLSLLLLGPLILASSDSSFDSGSSALLQDQRDFTDASAPPSQDASMPDAMGDALGDALKNKPSSHPAAPIPEPSGALLIAAIGVAILLRRRRFQRRTAAG